MTYISESGQILQVHQHFTDQNCHWIHIFKPLSFIVSQDAELMHQILFRCYRQFDSSNLTAYAKWLCGVGESGLLNLVHIFLCVCDLRGIPQLPSVLWCSFLNFMSTTSLTNWPLDFACLVLRSLWCSPGAMFKVWVFDCRFALEALDPRRIQFLPVKC